MLYIYCNPTGNRPNSAYSSGSNNNSNYGSTTSAAPIVRSAHVAATPYTNISDLNMYQSRWTIRARLTSKGEVRTWSNAKGEGSLFSVEFLDTTMDIRATFFKEAVDKFYGLLEIGKVYTVSGGRMKVANMQYNFCKSQFELSFDEKAEIHLDQSAEAANMATQSYELVPIASLEEVAAGQTVDVFGVCTQVSDVATILSKKSGKEMTKCDLTLQDASAAQINLTLWGQAASDAAGKITAGASLVAIRRARVSDYNGKSLSGSQSHTVVPFAQVATMEDATLQAAANPLLQWYQAQGGAAVKALSTARGGGGTRPALAERKPIQSIREDHLGTSGDAADWISFKGEISFIKKDKEGGAWYTACPNAGEPCQNRYKVTPTTDGQYHCEKCGSYYPTTVRRWIFSAMLEDGSGSTWVSFFNDQAETLLGTTADEVYTASGGVESYPELYEAAFAPAAHSEWIFRCKVKQDIVNDEARVKTSVVSMFPLDYVQDAKDMLAALQL
jgi:replication factor A1